MILVFIMYVRSHDNIYLRDFSCQNSYSVVYQKEINLFSRLKFKFYLENSEMDMSSYKNQGGASQNNQNDLRSALEYQIDIVLRLEEERLILLKENKIQK